MKNSLHSILGLLAAAVFATGCATQSPLCTLKSANGQAIPANFTGTTGKSHQGHGQNHVNVIQNMQTACCENFDRIVLQYDGVHHADYTIKYAKPPFTDCGSGMTHKVPGNAWLTVNLRPAQAHTDAGQPTVPREQSFNCANLKHISDTCDFEGVVEYVVGLNAKRPYRVLELNDPARLVIDIKH